MANYSIQDQIRKLEEEKEILGNDWKDELCDQYCRAALDRYIEYANQIEKVMQEVNQGIEAVQNNMAENEEQQSQHNGMHYRPKRHR